MTNVSGQDKLVDELNKAIVPIISLYPGEDATELNEMKPILVDKRIISLGEATHGTKEFSLYKDKMIRFLVSELGFRNLIIEADFTGTQIMNDYIVNGKGSPQDALQNMLVGVWFTPEFLNMVEWLRQYNVDKAATDQVKFYGCDMQFALNSAGLLNNGQIKLNKELSIEAKEGLRIISGWKFTKIAKSDVPSLEILSRELRILEVDDSDPQSKALKERHLETIAQTIEYALEPTAYERDIIRDKSMANNIEWIANSNANGKMIIWAHNLHVAKDYTKNKNLPMGSYLANKFAGDYYAVGFGFSSGHLNAYNVTRSQKGVFIIPEVKIKNSSDYIFKQLNKPNFYLDFKKASASPLIKGFLDQKLHARAIGASYDENEQAGGQGGTYQKLSAMYDAIVFIRETSAISFFSGK